MRKRLIEGVGYYLSCTIFFNIIFLWNCCANGLAGDVLVHLNDKDSLITFTEWMNISTALISVLFTLLGIVATKLIIARDDSILSTNTLGRTITVTQVENMTIENYFANYSLIVLTGLALPAMKGVWSLLIFLMIWFSLGIVYINNAMIYMNPILSIKKYCVYKCHSKEDEKTYFLVVKDMTIDENQVIHYSAQTGQIIRLHNLPSDKG